MWYQAFMLVLLGATATAQTCHYQQRVCECDANNAVCTFNMVAEQLLTFTSYKLIEASSGIFVRQHNAPGHTYHLDDMGKLQPDAPEMPYVDDPAKCIVHNETFKENNCSEPMIIDSTTDGTFYALNGLIPGPTIVVTYNQTVAIKVKNSLINDELTIHWHGMYQNSTPWMDGVSHITQCPINTFSSFQYIFKAIPSGTMWYHSHVGTQRTEGIFGSLVVREKEDVIEEAQTELQRIIKDNFTIADMPEHTISMLDWQRNDVDMITQQLLADIPMRFSYDNGTFSSLDIGVEDGPDGAEVSRFGYWAGIINGLGRQSDVPYVNSRLSIFNVEYLNNAKPLYYRFRLVGAMNRVMYRFSISEHKLIVIATDGYFTEPKEVDYIHIHTGERYDFLLKPKTKLEANGTKGFRILAETVVSSEEDPNIAEAILYYGDGDPPSTDYEQIADRAPRKCDNTSMCSALNCPFLRYPPGSYTTCIPVTDLQLLFATQDEIPSNTIQTKNQHFFDFAFRGISDSAAINGRNFIVPSGSLQTQNDSEMYEDICQLGRVNCAANPDQCTCTQIIDLDEPFQTIQFVLSAVGDKGATYHPIHLHGHSFQVAGIFYPEYFENATKKSPNPNITCHNDRSCTNPGWTNDTTDGFVNNKTVRKDTIVIPAGGYVVIRFISDNWGYWYMHCHIEPHFIEGMAVVINEGWKYQNRPPEQLKELKCGNFNWTVADFDESIDHYTPENISVDAVPSDDSGGASGLAGGFWLHIILLAVAMGLLKNY